jgi:hypothetical protein
MLINQPWLKSYQGLASGKAPDSSRTTIHRKTGHPNSKEFRAHAEATN